MGVNEGKPRFHGHVEEISGDEACQWKMRATRDRIESGDIQCAAFRDCGMWVPDGPDDGPHDPTRAAGCLEPLDNIEPRAAGWQP